jgi:predicted MFS family arabinose efflux permease
LRLTGLIMLKISPALEGQDTKPADRASSRPTADLQPKGGSSRKRAITLLACAGFASSASIRVCDPVIPQLAAVFDTSAGEASAVISVFSVAYGLFLALYGPLGDRYSKYWLVTMATLACTVGSLAAAFAPNLDWLVAARVLTGATAAAIIPLSMAWIGDNVEYGRRQAVLARFLSGQILGMVGGQFLGGLMADTLGWRWSFHVLAALYIVVGLSLLLELLYGGVAAGGVGKSGGGMPLATAMRSVVRVPWARAILLIGFVEGAAVFGPLAFIPTYLHLRFDLSLTGSAAILGTYGLGGLLYSLTAKRLVRLFGEQGLAAGGGALLCVAFITLLTGTAWQCALGACLIAEFGFYMLHNTLQINSTQMVPGARGSAVALFVSAFFLGQSTGVALAAWAVDAVGPLWLFGSAAVALPVIGSGFALALHRRHISLAPL